ncbi:hypothetical protein [Caballeronia sp. BR00000012568055]|uniref:hypothetical protein n=1 Tax=Caballeronia sp. BR00000012568055 TaxID=2918761 RepID=UPI0023F82DD5|nr:hypothetical protein [Caballeronia sp. BR00000012568055]
MATAIIQFDDRPAESLAPFVELVRRNQRYAAAHGYDHLFIDEIDLDIPMFWVKPFLVADLLATRYDTVLWLDTDAVVHNLTRTVESLFTDAAAMVFSPDNPLWQSTFNAGVFACNKPALPILREWCDRYPKEQWLKNERGEWKCLHEQWAGPAFEQGAFVESILPKYAETGLLKSLPWTTLQSPLPTEDAFSLHFSAYFKWNIELYLAANA